jgi:guanylate kinase
MKQASPERGGLLVVISSPSGGGKTAVVQGLLQRDPSTFVYSVTATTRPPRPGEREGVDYYFVSPTEFARMRDSGELIEWAEVHGFFYGTPRSSVEGPLREGKVVLMAIDVKGGQAVRRLYPHCSLLVFIKPPSMRVLRERLMRRSTEGAQEIEKRLQRAAMELAAARSYDHVVVNRELERTIERVAALIAAAKRAQARRERTAQRGTRRLTSDAV